MLCLAGPFQGLLSAADETFPDAADSETPGFVSGEFIYELEGRQTPQCHASTIVETSAGLVTAWFGGTHEKNPDVGIWVSRQIDGAWSKPVQVVDGSEGETTDYACWNPVLFQPKTSPLMLFYKAGPSPSTWWGMLMTSDDCGLTWSPPRRLGKDPVLGEPNTNLLGPVKNKPVQLPDGSILCASSSEHDGWRVHFERTRDLGRTWEVIGPINNASQFNAIQPSVLTYADGRMQILCRTQEGAVASSWTSDGGQTWSPLESSGLPNPNSGTDAVTLSDGRQLLVYNHTVRRGDFPAGREMLNVATSTDGKNWKTVLTLEKSKGEYSYPAVIQTSDGHVHVTYTWKRQTVRHVVLDPQKL
ncbi:MAG: exo-alpha-sialidase [Planctomycetaceae bacterium]|nr:exo-alpha-sialidase [Planctomycetaceae bacterium]